MLSSNLKWSLWEEHLTPEPQIDSDWSKETILHSSIKSILVRVLPVSLFPTSQPYFMIFGGDVNVNETPSKKFCKNLSQISSFEALYILWRAVDSSMHLYILLHLGKLYLWVKRSFSFIFNVSSSSEFLFIWIEKKSKEMNKHTKKITINWEFSEFRLWFNFKSLNLSEILSTCQKYEKVMGENNQD